MFRHETRFSLKENRNYVNLTEVHREIRDHFIASVPGVRPTRVRISFHHPLTRQGWLEFYELSEGVLTPADASADFLIEASGSAWKGWVREGSLPIQEVRTDPDPEIRSLVVSSGNRYVLRKASGFDPVEELLTMCSIYMRKKGAAALQNRYRIVKADLSKFVTSDDGGKLSIRFETFLNDVYCKCHIERNEAYFGSLVAYAMAPSER